MGKSEGALHDALGQLASLAQDRDSWANRCSALESALGKQNGVCARPGSISPSLSLTLSLSLFLILSHSLTADYVHRSCTENMLAALDDRDKRLQALESSNASTAEPVVPTTDASVSVSADQWNTEKEKNDKMWKEMQERMGEMERRLEAMRNAVGNGSGEGRQLQAGISDGATSPIVQIQLPKESMEDTDHLKRMLAELESRIKGEFGYSCGDVFFSFSSFFYSLILTVGLQSSRVCETRSMCTWTQISQT